MNPAKTPLTLVFAFTLALADGLRAQNPSPTPPIPFPELPQASPACTTIQHVGLSEVKIVYSRPGMKHHAIFGGIVPYNDLWRTGDNASTKITFSTPVKLGPDGVEIPAGTYGLYTIPDKKPGRSSSARTPAFLARKVTTPSTMPRVSKSPRSRCAIRSSLLPLMSTTSRTIPPRSISPGPGCAFPSKWRSTSSATFW